MPDLQKQKKQRAAMNFSLLALLFIPMNFPTIYCSKPVISNSPVPAGFDSAHSIPRQGLRRCTSVSSKMSNESDTQGSETYEHFLFTNIYNPVHTPTSPCFVRKTAPGLQSSRSRVQVPEPYEEYTQLQTQLFPLIRF